MSVLVEMCFCEYYYVALSTDQCFPCLHPAVWGIGYSILQYMRMHTILVLVCIICTSVRATTHRTDADRCEEKMAEVTMCAN